MKTLYIKDCIICGATFSYYKYPSTEKAKIRVTCSESCRLKLVSSKLKGRYIPNKNSTKDLTKWETTQCRQCGKSIYHQSSIKRVFCSHKCKGVWQKENLKGKQNPNWVPLDQRKPFRNVSHKIRNDLILERKECETCKSTSNLQVHHKDRNRGNNHPDNLMLLCNPCHANIHEQKGELSVARLIRIHPQTK